MNAEEVAEYCRRCGLYPEQLQRWRHDCEQAASLFGSRCDHGYLLVAQ